MPPTDLDRLQALLNARLGSFLGRAPRYRYFQQGNGPMSFWTVERYDAEGDSNGRFGGLFVSGVYEPVGAGSRSGRAERWQLADDSLSGAPLRKDAKARALRLHNAMKAGKRKPWRT